jgi:plastocyanin
MKKWMHRLSTATGLAILTFCSMPFSGFGATAIVQVVNLKIGPLLSGQFIPATTNIAVNDQITWVWPSGSGPHDATSDDGIWASPTQYGPANYSHIFTSAGSYPYTCSIHYFTGTINVVGPNVPPGISITNPAPDTVFSEPANVAVQASATDSDGTVTNVQFLVGSTVLTNESAAPFCATASSLAAGSYTLTAIASDNGGAMATNAVAIDVVAPVSIAISAPTFSSASFQFNYTANAGLQYIVQYSTNLASSGWTAIVTNTATGSPSSFVDPNATNSPAFYRVVRLPNP